MKIDKYLSNQNDSNFIDLLGLKSLMFLPINIKLQNIKTIFEIKIKLIWVKPALID